MSIKLRNSTWIVFCKVILGTWQFEIEVSISFFNLYVRVHLLLAAITCQHNRKISKEWYRSLFLLFWLIRHLVPLHHLLLLRPLAIYSESVSMSFGTRRKRTRELRARFGDFFKRLFAGSGRKTAMIICFGRLNTI